MDPKKILEENNDINSQLQMLGKLNDIENDIIIHYTKHAFVSGIVWLIVWFIIIILIWTIFPSFGNDEIEQFLKRGIQIAISFLGICIIGDCLITIEAPKAVAYSKISFVDGRICIK